MFSTHIDPISNFHYHSSKDDRGHSAHIVEDACIYFILKLPHDEHAKESNAFASFPVGKSNLGSPVLDMIKVIPRCWFKVKKF
jgi:hypothetical protein